MSLVTRTARTGEAAAVAEAPLAAGSPFKTAGFQIGHDLGANRQLHTKQIVFLFMRNCFAHGSSPLCQELKRPVGHRDWRLRFPRSMPFQPEYRRIVLRGVGAVQSDRVNHRGVKREAPKIQETLELMRRRFDDIIKPKAN